MLVYIDFTSDRYWVWWESDRRTKKDWDEIGARADWFRSCSETTGSNKQGVQVMVYLPNINHVDNRCTFLICGFNR